CCWPVPKGQSPASSAIGATACRFAPPADRHWPNQGPFFFAMISSTTEIRVRYAETDRMGVAYHGNYMAWFEVARVNMLDELGCPYLQMEADGFRLPVLEVSVRYRRPLTFDDRVTIEAVIGEKPSLRIKIDYTLRCR